MCMYVCIHFCIYVFIYVCMYPCLYLCIHVCVYAFIYVCMHSCMHVFPADSSVPFSKNSFHFLGQKEINNKLRINKLFFMCKLFSVIVKIHGISNAAVRA